MPQGRTNTTYTFELINRYISFFFDDFETPTAVWEVRSPPPGAYSGQWERGVPEEWGSSWTGEIFQPGEDHTPGTGNKCYVTGATAGPEDDVDDGITALMSPVFDLSALRDPWVGY